MTEMSETGSGQAGAALAPPPVAIGRASLFLDFDGTLVEIAPRPDAVEIVHGLIERLESLSARLSGRLAIVSGRSVDTIVEMLPVKGLAIGGSHGLEMRWPDGRYQATADVPRHGELLERLREFAAPRPGVLVEDKPFGAGLHYREAPDQADPARELIDELAQSHDLTVQSGKMVFELRPSGHHKGDAIRVFQAEPPFAEGTPWFVGDDVTDEDGFTAVRELGGVGVLVGAPRRTAARFRLDGVDAVHQWLKRIEETAR